MLLDSIFTPFDIAGGLKREQRAFLPLFGGRGVIDALEDFNPLFDLTGF